MDAKTTFEEFVQQQREQFPRATIIFPSASMPVVKPFQTIKILPAVPGLELDGFEPSWKGKEDEEGKGEGIFHSFDFSVHKNIHKFHDEQLVAC
jgi:hypothetical protein